MHDYRLYFLDGKGHIGQAIGFACEDDEAALQRAEGYRDGRDMELWQQARLVRALPARALNAPSPGREREGPIAPAMGG
ncbi:MAG: hypothetical protein JSR45_14905 [Proteobacteria bacterium]|nr:hypothetical protein [Pseudomonadota bacterium]